MCSVCCIVHTVYCIVYTVYCIIYSARYTIHYLVLSTVHLGMFERFNFMRSTRFSDLANVFLICNIFGCSSVY